MRSRVVEGDGLRGLRHSCRHHDRRVAGACRIDRAEPEVVAHPVAQARDGDAGRGGGAVAERNPVCVCRLFVFGQVVGDGRSAVRCGRGEVQNNLAIAGRGRDAGGRVRRIERGRHPHLRAGGHVVERGVGIRARGVADRGRDAQRQTADRDAIGVHPCTRHGAGQCVAKRERGGAAARHIAGLHRGGTNDQRQLRAACDGHSTVKVHGEVQALTGQVGARCGHTDTQHHGGAREIVRN